MVHQPGSSMHERDATNQPPNVTVHYSDPMFDQPVAKVHKQTMHCCNPMQFTYQTNQTLQWTNQTQQFIKQTIWCTNQKWQYTPTRHEVAPTRNYSTHQPDMRLHQPETTVHTNQKWQYTPSRHDGAPSCELLGTITMLYIMCQHLNIYTTLLCIWNKL